jgi:hypothetical protein
MMTFDVPRCPTCGGRARALSERVSVNAALTYDRERHAYDYAGESEVFWDTQETEHDPDGRVELWCSRGHAWKARISDAKGT